MFRPTDCIEPDLERAAGEVIDGEAIIINLASGVYYSMQGIGGEIWQMIEQRRSVGSMIEQIAASYEVAADQARTDLHDVLRRLAEDQLVRVVAGGSNGHAVNAPVTRRPYTRPELQVYRDMEDLLALDPPAPGMTAIDWKK